MRKIKYLLILLLLFVMGIGCGKDNGQEGDLTGLKMEEIPDGAVYISLSGEQIEVNAESVEEREREGVYVARDIVYYEEGRDFTYGEGKTEEQHSSKEASEHKVIHITRPGTYVLSGKLPEGQIAVDLGKNAKKDSDAVVTLVLNNADISCRVAPAIIFYQVYECGDKKEERAHWQVDTRQAGANIVIADDSVNHIEGSHVARIYEEVQLNKEGTKVKDSKTLHKYDGAIYSGMTMNIYGGEKGNGALKVKADNEGIGTKLHMSIYGGNIDIASGNDGMNCNEDNVSVISILGGSIRVVATGETKEGDGIDSNGWIVVRDGEVKVAACGSSMDTGLDAARGIRIEGGNILAAGNMVDRVIDAKQNCVIFYFEKSVEMKEILHLKGNNCNLQLHFENNYQCVLVSRDNLEAGVYTLVDANNKELPVVVAEEMENAEGFNILTEKFHKKLEIKSGENFFFVDNSL